MADNSVTAIEAMVEYPTKLQSGNLAPVKEIAAAIPAGDKNARIIGYVYGEARGVSWRNNANSADGSPSGALVGAFEGTPAYDDYEGIPEELKCKNRPRLQSGICFLPTQAQEAVIAAVLGDDAKNRPNGVKRGQRADVLGVSVPVAVELGIRKSDSPVGYEWVVRGLAKVSAENPVERMRRVMGIAPGANLAKLVDQADKGGLIPVAHGKANAQAALPAPGKSDKKSAASARKRK